MARRETRELTCACCGQRLPDVPNPVQIVAAEHEGLPVAEIIDRGWLGDATTIHDADDLRHRLRRFFGVDNEAGLRSTLYGCHHV